MDNHKLENQNLQSELLQMGFTSQQIKNALLIAKNKQSAIQYIMSNSESINNLPKPNNQNDFKNQNEQDFQSDQQQSYKMIFLMRMDLKLTIGKMASQIANATLGAYKSIDVKKQTDEFAEVAFYQWIESGTKKIVVKVQSEQELLNLVQKIKLKNINFYLCRTIQSDQINLPQGTLTCCAIGPAEQDVLDSLTGHLKLL